MLINSLTRRHDSGNFWFDDKKVWASVIASTRACWLCPEVTGSMSIIARFQFVPEIIQRMTQGVGVSNPQVFPPNRE
jgi:hypothetical protein